MNNLVMTGNVVAIVDRSDDRNFIYLFTTKLTIDGFNLFNRVCSILLQETNTSISEIYNFFGCLVGVRGFTFSKRIIKSKKMALKILTQALTELGYLVKY